jgi:superfamily II DNA or RNA helicase
MRIKIQNNHSNLVIGGRDHLVDPALLANIRNYMRIRVPGAWHSEQFQKHVWDGYKYFCTPKGRVPTGMLPTLLAMLEEDYPELEVVLEDERANQIGFKDEWDTEVGDYAMEGTYDYQLAIGKAFDNYLTFRDQRVYFPRGIVDAATNAGKSTIIGGLCNNVQEGANVLITIHRKAIFKQLVEFMGQAFGDVGLINDKYYEVKPITVAMIQTLSRRAKTSMQVRHDIASFQAVVVDEAHRAGSKEYKGCLKYSDAFMRMFLSGTAFDSNDDISKLEMIALSGMKLKEVKKSELMGKGISTPVEVNMHLCNTVLYDMPMDYRTWVEDSVHYSIERVSIMKKLVNASSGPMIIAVDKIEHGQFIFDKLREMGTDKTINFTHGEDPAQLDKIDQFKAGDFDVLISTGILSEGVNLPKVKGLIFAVGGKSAIQVKQWMGRIERKHSTKDKAVFHDFYDVGNYIKAHSEKRMTIYHQESLPVLTDFDLKFAKKLKSIVL